MHGKRRWLKLGLLFGSAMMLLQTAGCAIDEATMQSIVLPLVTQLISSMASGTYCTA